ncbi:ribosomal large subunit pseudouridine synthase B [Ichthyobacterium seriolicida]|uniref:Pseudouridine synthase n=1 Tax=Ichthyobacterium seriolicida TaxID=242600 RepID=A0A1J1DWI3_9FLAO|nr:ribosomal large subunit pseudouridine synthase B [Ichthyobacterium seriolicida]
MKDNSSDKGKIRLNKFIAHSGVCSRREADMHIKIGQVKVNGKVISEMGYKVNPTDKVHFGDKPITFDKLVYILLNKPKNFITTTKDPRDRKTVLDLVKNATPSRVYPVGRLDRMTTGVLLITNDGDISKKLTHPSHRVKKIYHVSLDKKFSMSDLEKVYKGIKLEDGLAVVDKISYIKDAPKTEVGIEIHIGKNRIVRRIFEHLGYSVIKLDRVFFAGFTKKNLKRGEWRFLENKEINILKMM